LTYADKNIIDGGEWLTLSLSPSLSDVHIEHFHHLLRNCSEYTPVEI